MNRRSSEKTQHESSAAANLVRQKKGNGDSSQSIPDNRSQNAAIQKKQALINSQPNAPVQLLEDVTSLTKNQKAAFQSLKHQGLGETDITIAMVNTQVAKLGI